MLQGQAIVKLMVEKSDILAALCELLEPYNKAGLPLTGDTLLASDLEIDSVDMMNLTMEVEDRFDVDIPINALADVNTIGDLLTLLMQKTGGG